MLIGSVQRDGGGGGLNPSNATYIVKTHVPTETITMLVLKHCCIATVS